MKSVKNSKTVVRRLRAVLITAALVVLVGASIGVNAATNKQIAQHQASLDAESELVKLQVQCYVEAVALGLKERARYHASIVSEYTEHHKSAIEYNLGWYNGFLRGARPSKETLQASYNLQCLPRT